MSYREYPPRGLYHLPKKNILVLSCIDLRLTDNLLEFLHFENLTNRYDHFALAGTSLITQADNDELTLLLDHDKLGSEVKSYKTWNDVWRDHIRLAIILHDIKDIYIIEHEDCGAYKTFLTAEALSAGEHSCHVKFATALANQIHEFEMDDEGNTVVLNVHCFLIDLRGNIEHLYSI
ncbi:hypothetical protein SAMN04487996_101283 [Dyadobacter soli]|uniref:Carbonic anhydrase n=1 Tax=Dyadobacter soli TaxID=659014 RepID=A0A1G6VM41_9BACT|nr:hypothetical protein [Dyadobacter soli]SDD54581.1 hypothetical protein SAMN04487996_101283 [Dyadobacter soli]